MKHRAQQPSVDCVDAEIRFDEPITLLVIGKNRLFLQARYTAEENQRLDIPFMV